MVKILLNIFAFKHIVISLTSTIPLKSYIVYILFSPVRFIHYIGELHWVLLSRKMFICLSSSQDSFAWYSFLDYHIILFPLCLKSLIFLLQISVMALWSFQHIWKLLFSYLSQISVSLTFENITIMWLSTNIFNRYLFIFLYLVYLCDVMCVCVLLLLCGWWITCRKERSDVGPFMRQGAFANCSLSQGSWPWSVWGTPVSASQLTPGAWGEYWCKALCLPLYRFWVSKIRSSTLSSR